MTHSLAMSKRFNSTGRSDRVGHEAREVDRVEEVRVEGDGEGQRRDGEVQAADAQRGQADEHGDHRADHGRERQR